MGSEVQFVENKIIDTTGQDLIIPKEMVGLVDAARDEMIKVESQYLEGAITNGERYNKVIAIW